VSDSVPPAPVNKSPEKRKARGRKSLISGDIKQLVAMFHTGILPE